MMHVFIYINLLLTARPEKCNDGQGYITIFKEKKKFKNFL